MDEQTVTADVGWIRNLNRFQLSVVAFSVVLALALAAVLTVILVGPLLNLLGLQAIGA